MKERIKEIAFLAALFVITLYLYGLLDISRLSTIEIGKLVAVLFMFLIISEFLFEVGGEAGPLLICLLTFGAGMLIIVSGAKMVSTQQSKFGLVHVGFGLLIIIVSAALQRRYIEEGELRED